MKQIPIDRKSLTLSLEDRYRSQSAGGAFDAKDITTSGHASLSKAGTSLQSARWTPAGFKTQAQSMTSEFNEKALNYLDTQGFSNKRYAS